MEGKHFKESSVLVKLEEQVPQRECMEGEEEKL
jgi:hypothetical protein